MAPAAALVRDAQAAQEPAALGPRRLVPTAALGLVATLTITFGALLGGSSFETHLPGAWFFGMPGGPFGSLGSSSANPPIYAVIPVYGGLILDRKRTSLKSSH